MDDLRRSDPGYAMLLTLTVPSATELQQLLPADTALVEYVMAENNLATFVLSSDHIWAKTTSVSTDNLQARVELFRDLIVRPDSDSWRAPAVALRKILISPLEQEGWLKGIRKLYIVPNGVLNYVPFAALVRNSPGGTQFLVDDYVLAYLPAASVLTLHRNVVVPDGKLLAMAPKRAHLRYAEEEVEDVSRFFSSGRLVLTGTSATKDVFEQKAGSYQFLHLATHGFLNKEAPLLSQLELEPSANDEGFLEVHEILGLRLNARLVTLSACETALGSGYFSEVPAGDDFVGFTRAFLTAGSQAVMASLWEVNDRSTLHLMVDFYRRLTDRNNAGAFGSITARPVCQEWTLQSSLLLGSVRFGGHDELANKKLPSEKNNLRPCNRSRRRTADRWGGAMRKRYRRLSVVVRACSIALLLALSLRPSSAQVSVTSSTPNNAPQGTTNLTVTITGSDFDNGARATWYVTGTTNTGGVTVNSTTFVNSSQLTANITVASNATVSGYDIQVANGNGRTGVGSDLFTVNPMSVTSTLYSTDSTGASVTVQGDNSSGSSAYGNIPSSCSLKPHSDCTIMDLLPNDWYLRLYSGSRTIYVTFTALGNSQNESVLNGYYLAQVATRCFDSSNNWASIPATIPPGTSNNRCSLRVNFTAASGTNYFYIMSPQYPGTGWSTVSCTAGITGICNSWTILPTPGSLGPNPNVANLYSVAKNGKMTLLGTYEMTFNITLTQP